MPDPHMREPAPTRVNHPRRTVTSADVARMAGVSSQTVSRVANGEAHVRPETRSRVISAMRALGYRPNGAARALKRGTFDTIGVITFTLSSYGNLRTVEAITRSMAERGYSVNLLLSLERTQQSVSGAYNRLAEEAVDGVVVIYETGLADAGPVDLPPGLPVLVVGTTGPEMKHPTIDVDQEQGARQATEHLLDLGHTRIWHVRGPRDAFAADKRAEAWAGALAARGLHTPDVIEGDWSAASGYAAGVQLAERDDVTAVFAANDSMAAGLILALHEHGIRVPEQISVVGFDNAPDSQFLIPPLTTVDQNFAQVGELSADLLLDEVRKATPPPAHSLIGTHLVIRESTCPPPGRR